MEYYKKILCVTLDELTTGDNPIIKASTLRSCISRGNIQTARQGKGEGNYALYVYSSLPEKYKTRFVDKYGDPSEVMKQQRLKECVTIDQKAREVFEVFEYDLNGVQTHLKTEIIEEYTINASVLNELVRMQTEMETLTKMGNNPRRDTWDAISATADVLREIYGHTLPNSLSRLKERIIRYKKEGYISLISGKLGNQNTLKITEEGGSQLIALKRSRVPVYTDVQLFNEYNRIATCNGWKPLKSIRSMKTWLSSPAVEPLWWDAVHGELSSRIKYDRRHRTKLPELRDSLWYGDGTKLNLYYRGEDGKVYTTSVYEVIDAATEVMLGYYISDNEDYIAQYHAFRMAIQVSRHKPYEIVTDNQGGHKKNTSVGFFSKIAKIHRPTAPYNGRSKTIENLFYRFQKDVLHKLWNFTGQNVTTVKLTSRPNIEFIEANKDKLPTRSELLKLYAQCRKEWNEMEHPASGMRRIDMYNQSVNIETQEVGIYDMIDMFWYKTEKPSTFTASGIEITVKKKKYAYEVFGEPGKPDLEWRRQHTYERFYVQYDPYDMTSVRLITEDGRFARVAEPPIVIARAQQEQTAEDKAFIKAMADANTGERVERQVRAKKIEQAHGVSPEQNGLHTPSLKGLNKEAQQQIDRRTARYSLSPEEYQSGRWTKKLSNMDWSEAGETPVVEEKKLASKL